MTKANGQSEGRRRTQLKVRDQTIQDAAMTLAEALSWPSPAAVEQATGIDESTIERQKHLLRPARRRWVELNGAPHPHWTDTEDGKTASEEEPRGPQPKETHEDRESRRKDLIAKQRVTIGNLKNELELLREQVRRLVIGVRPSELDDILKAGTPKHRLN
jgi:hypothetical protein